MRPIGILIVMIMMSACSSSPKYHEDVRNIDLDKQRSVGLDEISDDYYFKPLQLPDSILFGEITNIKTYDDILFLHDRDRTASITAIQADGKFICQLKKKGKGPGEYLGIEAFSYDKKNKNLIIYDRLSQSFQYYKFPSLKPLRKKHFKKYVSDFELLNDKMLLLADDDEIMGMSFWDVQLTKSFGQFFTNNPLAVELFNCNSLSKYNGRYYFFHPLNGNCYRIDDDKTVKLTPAGGLSYGKYSIPEEILTDEEEVTSRKIEEIREQIQENSYAIFPQNILLNQNNDMAFWFLQFRPDTDKLWHLAMVDKDNGTSNIYEEVYIGNKKHNLPVPCALTSWHDYYVSAIYPDIFEASTSQWSASDRTAAMNTFLKDGAKAKSGEPVLLFYKPKFN